MVFTSVYKVSAFSWLLCGLRLQELHSFSASSYHQRQRSRDSTTQLQVRPQDFAAGKIGMPLPLRGFPMPETDEEEEEEEFPTRMARPELPFTSPPPNPDPALERARLSQPPMKKIEPVEKVNRSGPAMPDLTAPARPEQQPATEKAKFSFFPAPKVVEEPKQQPAPMMEKPSLFGYPAAESAPPSPVEPSVEKPTFSLFGKQPEVQDSTPAPAPSPVEAPVEQPSFTLFGKQPEVQESAPAPPVPVDEEKTPLSLFTKPESAPEAPSVTISPVESVKEAAPVEPPPTKSAVPDTVSAEPSPVLSTVQEQPKIPKQEKVVQTAVENRNPAGPLETASEKSAQQPSTRPAEPTEEPRKPVVAVEQPVQSATKEEPSAAKPQPTRIEAKSNTVKTESQVPITKPPPTGAESLPPLSSSIPSINFGLSPLAIVPFGALAAGRSLLAGRESKQKELEAQLQRIQDRRQKELSSSNAYVFVVLAVAALSFTSLLVSVLDSAAAGSATSSVILRGVASTNSPISDSAIQDKNLGSAVGREDGPADGSLFPTKTIAGLWSPVVQEQQQ